MNARLQLAPDLSIASNPFIGCQLRHGVLADLRKSPFPTTFSGWLDMPLELPGNATHFAYVHAGAAHIDCSAGHFTLSPGMYFSIAGAGRISGDGQGIVLTRHGASGMFQIGGPVEAKGRLNYIDGCTDSLLIPPVLRGDACLNLLCFPKGIDQTAHTHPSLRAGMVISGSGQCRTAQGILPLIAGHAFLIHADQLHAFSTPDEGMRVIAFHPDSDFGPTDQNHPMINRTMVNGVSASGISNIQTRSVPDALD
jgi:quercetin dioxygenase-like cupin family protein